MIVALTSDSYAQPMNWARTREKEKKRNNYYLQKLRRRRQFCSTRTDYLRLSSRPKALQNEFNAKWSSRLCNERMKLHIICVICDWRPQWKLFCSCPYVYVCSHSRFSLLGVIDLIQWSFKWKRCTYKPPSQSTHIFFLNIWPIQLSFTLSAVANFIWCRSIKIYIYAPNKPHGSL